MAATGASPAERSEIPPKASTPGKNIVLFSDGTGNSSAKLFKTNVWRMYEAVDLGPSPNGDRDQISFYDDGVGTSGFKILAALGGAFGWGLKRNVLDIYRYACRNYRDGDQIYAFGFSRGAFTIRLVIDLIASQGLVQSDDESELYSRSIRAYRAYRRKYLPRYFGRVTTAVRGLRDSVLKLWPFNRGGPYSPEKNCKPIIRFVGVWDTVAAYGGPIIEITRAIDNWIYPLSMSNYQLGESVLCARHALALDDERDAFWPLLWDEVAEEGRADAAKEKRLAAASRASRTKDKARKESLLSEAEKWGELEDRFRTRMRQVWFTGMHADVGGGYPDESLSYVSLLWMMEEAEGEDLRMLRPIKERFTALANSFGPMHNSRSGVGAYYRYQPRKIAAWLNPPKNQYLMLQDPEVSDRDRGKPGLLNRVLVHESVIARINGGTVRYAPISLPAKFEVIPPQAEDETSVQRTVGGESKTSAGPPKPLISAATRGRLKAGALRRFHCQENIWNLVWGRRILYFVTLGLTAFLIALPLGAPLQKANQFCSDSRCWLPSLIRSGKGLVPGFVEPWIEAVARYPITAFGLIALIWLLLKVSGALERKIWDRSYLLWRQVLDGVRITKCRRSCIRGFRESHTYQTLFRTLKWYSFPAFFGVLMVMAILYGPTVLVSQIAIQFDEVDHAFCKAEDPATLRSFGRAEFNFDASRPCVAPLLKIEKNQVYDVVFQLPVSSTGEPIPWSDGGIIAEQPSLMRVRASTPSQLLGVPFRRVIEASYLQPIVQTTRIPKQGRWLSTFGSVHITKLDLKQDADWPELYRVRFRAAHDSSLHFFANEAHLPFTDDWFYKNNCGVARVTITKILPRQRGVPPQELITEPGDPVPIPACAQATLNRQNAAQ